MRSYSCLQTIIGTALILSNALSATAQDSKKPMEVDRHFTEAKRARLSGDHLKAAESYEKARKIAKDQGLPKIQGEVALHLGETLDSHLKSDAKPEVHAKLQRQAEEH